DIARADLMRRVLPVLDDLDRAIAAARAAGREGALADGVALIRERLRQAMAAEGVEEIATAGTPFDPSVAEAVSTESTTDPGKNGLVVEEIERGYRLGGALLRPARVRVARLTEE
ncbi:MAG TPA: nucleotide exchange factor GrpE, partial [Candidatus Polarisedimenticolia bacterium]|nr:nucleotide exchange factor GrpE [Candidatus Polarisedimenticolia bacterium]